MFIKIVLGAIGAFLAYQLIKVYSDPGVITDQEAMTLQIYRLLITLAVGIFLGFLAIFYVLPVISQKAAQSMYDDSGAEPDQDILQDARAFMAQGEYDQAVVAYRQALEKEPSNRLGWTDLGKLYGEKLEQPKIAAAALREAFDAHEWEEEDGAFLLFRASEWHLDHSDDHSESQEAGCAILVEIMEAYPKTRHSANAMQKIRKLGYEVDIEVIEEEVDEVTDDD